jgi:ATP-dependent Clp protease ATP-binding subunit ClpC
MFERFTDSARRVVVKSQDEAKDLNHGYIGTEHLLLGILLEDDQPAAQALQSLGISFESARLAIVEIVGEGEQRPVGHIPFTPRGKKVLELALRESLRLGHQWIGSEHILLGLVKREDSLALKILERLGTDREHVIVAVTDLLPSTEPEVVRPVYDGGPIRAKVGQVLRFVTEIEQDAELREAMVEHNALLDRVYESEAAIRHRLDARDRG